MGQPKVKKKKMQIVCLSNEDNKREHIGWLNVFRA